MPSPTETHRDTIAEMLGFTQHVLDDGMNPSMPYWQSPSNDMGRSHPIPNTIDFVSAAWPDGVAFCKITGDTHEQRLEAAFHWYRAELNYLRAHDRPAFDAAVAKARRVLEGKR